MKVIPLNNHNVLNNNSYTIENCNDCPINFDSYKCNITHNYIDDNCITSTINKDCPLLEFKED